MFYTRESSREEGSLYPALQRLLLQGWVKGEWKMTETNRRARFYTLTAAGRKQLRSGTDPVRADDCGHQPRVARRSGGLVW
jgi:DNA-binding PadR family transcriptional regulator